MSTILHTINKVPDLGKAESVTLVAENMTINHTYVGAGIANSHLLSIMSVSKDHNFIEATGKWEMEFTMSLNGEPVSTKTFASNEAGKTGKLLRESFAYIGKLKSRRVK